ncbi:MAG: hypothetical protein A2097_14575 [Desulfobacula sp. GWF2_41_7]|nr:MAG: hypothetical protein A2097_14575 [Desulfobacula sp. GWF2_41_7]
MKFISIKTKVSILLLLISMLVVLCYIIYGSYEMNRKMKSEIRTITENESVRLSKDLASSVWNLEYDSAERHLQAAMHNKHIYGIIVWEKDRIFASLIRDSDWNSIQNTKEINKDYIFYSREILYDNQMIGKIDLYITDVFFYQDLKKSIIKMIVGTAIVNIIIAVVLFISLTRILIKPINTVSSWAAGIVGEKGNLFVKLEITSNDEIGLLSDALNRTARKLNDYQNHLEDLVLKRTEQLKTTQKELVEKAHKAGMADIATGTLHNIGNILNSAKTSVAVVRNTLLNSNISGLGKACAMLDENMENIEDFIIKNPKGKKLLLYFQKLGDMFIQEHKEYDYHLERVVQKLETAIDTIRVQQSYAGTGGFTEKANLRKLVEDAVLMLSEKTKKLDISIETEFNETREIYIQKAKLLNVIINLLKNAQESIVESNNTVKKISIRVYEDKKDGCVYIKIEDSGIGLTKEETKLIFSYGYSTKEDGHGFGLHSSANYMTEMNGQLWAESKGKTQGAVFIIKLPLS